MDRRGGPFDDDRGTVALPPLKDPFAAADDAPTGVEDSGSGDGPFALPPLPAAGLPPVPDAATGDDAAEDPGPEDDGSAPPFALDATPSDSPFRLPERNGSRDGESLGAWLEEAGSAPTLSPLPGTEPGPLRFALDRAEEADALAGFELDPGNADPITGAAFLSQREQALVQGGFQARRAAPVELPEVATEDGEPAPEATRPRTVRQVADAHPAARDPASSGIGHAPTARITRDPASSGISQAPTARHPRRSAPTADEGTAMTAPGSNESWDGSEGTMIVGPHSAPAAAENWDGSEGTMIVTPHTAPSADEGTAMTAPGSGEGWDGSEGTMVVGPRSAPAADESWDGSEGTMITPPAAEWDSEATSIGRGSGRLPWVGDEATAPFTPGARDPEPPPPEREEATRATLVPGKHTPPTLFTTNRQTRRGKIGGAGGDGSSGGTSTSFDAAWHFAGKPGPATGQVWGDYEIGGIVGQGGMGLVYRARQTSLGRRCAVKVLSAHLANNQQLLERFELEARAAGTMRSHNVVAVYAAGNVDGQPYYVMEYVDGTDLDHIVKERRAKDERFTVDEAIDYTLQAARGLVEADSHGIVHRDIKPPNLMVTAKGEVKITDFGIVKVQGEAGLTLTGQAMGTPAYLSPEQGRGEEVDTRSDLYSLGVVFYELLTGGRPFIGNSADALIYQHSYAEPKLPREIDASIPEDIQAVCIKLLAKKPENRYQSARDLVRDLEDFTEGKRLEALLQQKISTGGAEALRENQSWLQRHGLRIGLTMAALTLVAIGLAVWYNKVQQDAAQRRQNLAEQAGFLRESLAVLAEQQQIPEDAPQQLAALRTLLADPAIRIDGDEDQLARWQAKLDRVVELRAALAPIDEDTAWNHALLSAARTDLDALVDQVGATARGIREWSRLISTQEARREELRRALAVETDRSFDRVPAREREERIEPMIDQLARLAPEDDPEVAALRERVADWHRAEADLVADLDAAQARDPAADTAKYLLKVERQLEQAARLYGDDDARYLAWRNAVVDHVAAYRKGLARAEERFRTPRLASVITAAELEELHRLVDRLVDLEALEADRRERWQAVLAAADERWADIRAAEAELRPRLRAVLSRPAPIDRDVVTDLDYLAGLLGAEEIDVEIKEWQAKIRAVRELDRELGAAIDGRFFIADLDGAFSDLKRLQALVSDDDADVRRWSQRLDVLYGPQRPDWAASFGRDKFGIYAMVELPGDQTLRLRYIPPGAVELGSPVEEPGRDAKDEAQTQVRIPHAFWLAEAETTQAVWMGVTGENPSRHTSRSRSLDRPVNRVSLVDVRAFFATVARAREAAGAPLIGLRLPGEHEWEYACRAGKHGPFSYLRLSDDQGELPLGEYAWYAANSDGSEHPVAGKRPNPLGLYDMHGNVWEWCRNPYGSYQLLAADGFQAREADRQAVRGGGWGDPPANLRAANRLGLDPSLRSAYLGFRAAANVEWQREPDGSRILESDTPPTERIDRDLLEDAASDEPEPDVAPASDPTPAPPPGPDLDPEVTPSAVPDTPAIP